MMTTTQAREMAETFDKTTENINQKSMISVVGNHHWSFATRSSSRREKRKLEAVESVAGADSTAEQPTERKVPLYLNMDTCRGKRHFVKDCNKTPSELKEKLLAEHRKKLAEQREKAKKAKIQAVRSSSRAPSEGGSLLR